MDVVGFVRTTVVDFRRKPVFGTNSPLLKVDAGLPAGTYVFQLEVKNQSGNWSSAARIRLSIIQKRLRGK